MQFPSVFLSEKEKNEKYHLDFATAICRRSLNSGYALNLSVIDQSYKFFDGQQGSGDFKFLTEAAPGEALPAQWLTINKIRSKVLLLVGELLEKGYDLQVKAINKEAKSRKLEEKEKMRVDIRLKPIMEGMEEATGFQSNHDEKLPDSEDELDEFFEKNYKEISEIVLYYALKYLDKKNLWLSERTALFRDVLIAGKAFVKTEIINGLPRARRIDPRYMVYDSYSENDFLTDSTFFGEVRYMNIADAAVKYNVSEKDLKDAADNYSEFIKYNAKALPTRRNNLDVDFPNINGSGLNWYEYTNTGLRVLVLEACWVDYKVIKNKISEDNYGGEHFKEISDASKDKEGVVSKRVKQWRTATLLGGTKVVNWGPIKNQPRDVDSLSETYPPFCAVIPHLVNGRAVSVVEQLQSLQNLKDIIVFNIQLAMARAGAKGFIYDVSQCPDGWEPETVIKFLKTVGIAFIDSRQGGTPSQFNQFQQIDLSLSASVSQYLELSKMVDDEMNAISGINEARQGVMQGASQLASVTQSALMQSSLTTASYFRLFEQFNSNIWNQIARLVKIAWAGKERFAPIIGDAGVNFLEQDIELDLNDYAVFVESTPKILDDKNQFNALVMAGIQSGEVKLADALSLLMEKDVISAVRRFEKITKKREKEAIEQAQQHDLQMQQMKQQGNIEAQEKMNQYNQQTSEQATEKAKELQQMKEFSATQRDLIASRTTLAKQKMANQNAIALEEMKPEPKPNKK